MAHVTCHSGFLFSSNEISAIVSLIYTELRSLWLRLNWVWRLSTWNLVIFLPKEYFTGSIAWLTKAFGKMARDQRKYFPFISKKPCGLKCRTVSYPAHRWTAPMEFCCYRNTLGPTAWLLKKSCLYEKSNIWKSKQDFQNYRRLLIFCLFVCFASIYSHFAR